MRQVANSIYNCFKKLNAYNGKFINGLMFNFDKPKIFNEPPYSQALIGEVFINTRSHIGKCQSTYLLYVDNGQDLIRLQVLSKDKKTKLHIDVTNNETNKINYDNNIMILKFDDFTYFLDNNKISLEA